MTRRDYILNTFANKLATQDNPDGTLKDDAPVRPADMTPEDAESISPTPPMSLRDRISKHLGTAQGYAADNPTVSAAAGVGTLSALLAAVLSKKGKRLRNAGIAGVVGAAAGAGGSASIVAQRKKRVQQAAIQAKQQQEAPEEAQQASQFADQPKAPYSAR